MREVSRGGPHGPDRLLVVHPLRPEQADGTEAAVVEPVRRADEGGVPEPRVRQLDAEADERALLAERVAEQREEGPVRIEVLAPRLAQERCRAADEQALLFRACGVRESRAEQLQEAALALGEARVAERLAEAVRAERQPGRTLVQVLRGPIDQAWIDGLAEREHPLRHPAGGRDQNGDDELRLQREHLDVPHRRGLERWRRDEGEEPSHVGKRLGRRLQRRLDLVPGAGKVDLEPQRPRLEAVEQALREQPVSLLRGHAAGGGMRMREQAEPLELGELAPDGRRRDAQSRALNEVLRADGQPGGDVLLDEVPEDLPLTIAEFDVHLQEFYASRSAVTPPPRTRPRADSANSLPA